MQACIKITASCFPCICDRCLNGQLIFQGRELLMHMLDVYVLKFKSIAEQQLPALLAKCKQIGADGKLSDRNPAATSTATTSSGGGSGDVTTPSSPNDDTKPPSSVGTGGGSGGQKSMLDSVTGSSASSGSSTDKDDKVRLRFL